MSADNWTVCPRCIDTARKEAEAAHAEVMATYGSVPVDEFDARRAALPPREPDPDTYATFREDYDIGAGDGGEPGEVYVNYRGSCTTCGLAAALETSKKFWS